MQGGLQLPDREYYLSDAEQMKKVRAGYQSHISTMLKLAGFSDTDARASRIVELEHAIAKTHRSLAENEDIHKANNTWRQADFPAKAPGLDWAEYFRGAGLSHQGSFIVWQPDAFTAESALVASTELATWKDWMAFHVIEAYGGVLPKAIAQERFAFFGKELSGAQQQRPRWQRGVARLGKVVDKKEWSMTPQTVNAVNLPLQNALNFPAAILQPPFFDPMAPAAANYGAIGTVIGHEISHTFDTEGSAFDSKGRVRNWWTPEDLKHFEAATAQLAAQYDTYKPFPDLSLNGKQTLGENIADVAGISAAYDGYHESLAGKAAPMQDNFSGDQQFFIAFAQNWGSKTREAALRQQVMTDPHAPGEYRADTVRNIDAWYAAFNVQPGEKLYLAPGERVRIW